MAVITRYIVVRHGIELDQVFEDKKQADAYDRMLDAAENLAAFIKQGDLHIELDTKTVDEVSIYLARNAPEVNRILKGIKPIAPAAGKSEKPADPAPVNEKKTPGRKAGPKQTGK